MDTINGSTRPVKIRYDRLFSTGNFEHMKIGLEVESTTGDLGKDFQSLVATAIALKENGLETEREFTFGENAKRRIKELQDELKGLQAQLPRETEEDHED
jgi:hypothetical protein